MGSDLKTHEGLQIVVNYDWNKIKRAAFIRKSKVIVGICSVPAILSIAISGNSFDIRWMFVGAVFGVGLSLLVAWQLVSASAMMTHKEELIRLKRDLSWLSQISSKEAEFSQWASKTGCLAEAILKEGYAYQAEYLLFKSVTRCQQEMARSGNTQHIENNLNPRRGTK